MKKILFVMLLGVMVLSAGAIKSEAYTYSGDLPYTSDWTYNWDKYSWDGYFHVWELYNAGTGKYYAQILYSDGTPYMWYYFDVYTYYYYMYISYNGSSWTRYTYYF